MSLCPYTFATVLYSIVHCTNKIFKIQNFHKKILKILHSRIGNDDIPKSFTDILSKSSDLLLQFDPPANAWPFLHALPILGHTENNKRQDGNFQINFASFTFEDWSDNFSQNIQPCFNSFKSQYSLEMLESLGYIFTDKYIKSTDAQNLLKKIERDSTNDFHRFCSSLYKALLDNHCLSLDDFISQNMPHIHKTDNSTMINMAPEDDQFISVRQLTLTPMRIIFKPLNPERGNRALALRGVNNYIRVHIREENNELLDTLNDKIRLRFKLKMLENGIMCMNKTYYCIGCSTSQMKNFSYWFTTLNNGETIDQIQAQFGDFTAIKNVATYVARIGLYFSTSTPTGVSATHE